MFETREKGYSPTERFLSVTEDVEAERVHKSKINNIDNGDYCYKNFYSVIHYYHTFHLYH